MNKKLNAYIISAKKSLIKKIRSIGYYENLGQNELRKARDLINYETYKEDVNAVQDFEKFIDNL